jgi:endonuclease YncB( thermonuclease family)
MTYDEFITQVSGELDSIEKSIEDSSQRAENLRAAWAVGRDVYQYKQETGTLQRTIAEDLGLSVSQLDRYVRLFRLYPDSPAATVNGKPVFLSHYMALIHIYDAKERDFYITEAADNAWSSQEMRRRVRNSYYESYTESMAVRENAGSTAKRELKVAPQKLYTYGAEVLRVVDGDTLLLDIDVGFRMRSEQKARLRGINCPEAGTKRGDEATAFVKQQLYQLVAEGVPPAAVVRTYKSEKYGRYLVDLWYLPGESNYEKILANGRWLNQELLDNNLAVKVE